MIRLLALSFLTRALAELGRFTEGIAYGEEALRLAEPNMAFGLATALAGLGILYVRKAELTRRSPSSSGASRHRGPTALPTGSRQSRPPSAPRTCLPGGWKRASSCSSTPWTSIVAPASWPRCLCGARISETPISRLAGSLRRGRRRAARWASAGRGWSTATRPWALHVVAGILAASETPDVPDAHAHYTEALKLAESRGMRPLTVRCLVGLARLHERAGNAAAAASYRDRGVRLAAELGIPPASLDAT